MSISILKGKKGYALYSSYEHNSVIKLLAKVATEEQAMQKKIKYEDIYMRSIWDTPEREILLEELK